MTRPFLPTLLLVLLALLAGAEAWAEEAPRAQDVERAAENARARSGGRDPKRVGWGLDLQGAWLHVFDTNLEAGGAFSADRLALRASISYSPRPGLPLTVSIGYRQDKYDFDGGALGAASPWKDVHSLRAGIPLFAPLGDRFFVLALPAIRSSVEDGAPLEDGISWGAFGGVAYRVNDRLSIGPGVGYLTEIEDSPSVFPILLVDWKITPMLALTTGEGLGATQGPGVFLHWTASSRWRLSLGGRYERLRFRLSDRGPAPGGVGEDKSFAAVLSARCEPRPGVRLSGTLGMGFLGELRLEDADGRLLRSDDYDTSFFAGLGLSVSL